MGWPKKSLPSVVPCEGRHQVSSFARAKLTENLLWFAMVFKIFISEQSEHPPRSYLHARCETKRLEFFWWPHLLKEVAVTRPRCRTQHFLFMRFLPAHFSSLFKTWKLRWTEALHDENRKGPKKRRDRVCAHKVQSMRTAKSSGRYPEISRGSFTMDFTFELHGSKPILQC